MHTQQHLTQLPIGAQFLDTDSGHTYTKQTEEGCVSEWQNEHGQTLIFSDRKARAFQRCQLLS